uniref:Uncharacterized protein n=1 Tax=Octopus bimaculoides TaxID=37653 RepID=A0A0L8HA21_OCTBM
MFCQQLVKKLTHKFLMHRQCGCVHFCVTDCTHSCMTFFFIFHTFPLYCFFFQLFFFNKMTNNIHFVFVSSLIRKIQTPYFKNI